MNNTRFSMGTTTRLLSDLIGEGKFYEASQLLTGGDADEICATLSDVSSQRGIMVYSFANFMLQRKETAFWHRIAAFLIGRLCVPQNKNAVVYHLKKSIQLDPADWVSKQELLQYYEEGLISREEAYTYAKHVLIHNPTHLAGRRAIGILA